MTIFKQGVEPPPLLQWMVSISCPASLVLLPAWKKKSQASKCQHSCVVLVDKRLYLYNLASGHPELISDMVLPLTLPCDRMIWIAPTFIAMFSNISYQLTTISFLKVMTNKLVVLSCFDVPCNVIGIGLIGGTLILHNSKGGVISLDVESRELDFMFSLPEPCVFMEVTTEYGIFFLSDTFRLYWNADHVLTGVTSFIIHKGCLLATSLTHLMVFKIISENTLQLLPLPEKHLEGGSKIILAYDQTILLLVPRGYIETVQSLSLSVLAFIELIGDCKYNEAVSLLRREKIHMNLIVDHDEEKFINNVDKFLNEVKPEFISLFIAEFEEEDVSSSIYSAFYEGRKVNHREGKVEYVCKYLVQKMLILDQEKFASVILNGLIKIDRLDVAFFFANTDILFDHLLLSMDIDQLYHKALSIYDLDAAIKVAKKSDMDPKEYVPYIQDLKEMDPNDMQFLLDTKYKEPASALEHISKCTDDFFFSECLKHVKKHELYLEVMQIFKCDEHKYKEICLLYGVYLFEENSYERAGSMFKRCKDWTRALEAYSLAGNWRQCVIVARANDPRAVLEDCLSDVIASLENYYKFEELGDLHMEIFQKPSKAVEFYLKSKSWKKAIFLIQRYDLIDKATLMFNVLDDSYLSLIRDITVCSEKYASHLNRLNTINKLEETPHEPKNSSGVFDLKSDSCSLLSIRPCEYFVSYPRKTNMSFRKVCHRNQGVSEEKNSLICSMKEMIKEARFKLAGEVKSLCTIFLELNDDVRTLELQNCFSRYNKLLQESKKHIWPNYPEEASEKITRCDN